VSKLTSCPAVAEKIRSYGVVLSSHAASNDGYSERGNFGGSLILSIVLIYSPYGTNVYGSTGGIYDGIGSVKGLKIVSCSWGYFLFLFLFTCSASFATGCIVWSQCTASQTDRRTNDSGLLWH